MDFDISSSLTYDLMIIILIWVFAGIFIRYFGRFIKEADSRSTAFDIEKRTFKAIDNAMDTVAIIFAFSLTLSILGISGVLYTTLTAFGVIGIIIGLATKDITSNIISGIMMIFNPSFLLGDSIEVDGYAGKVEKISLRMTTLRRGDGVLLMLPNTLCVTKPIVNYTAAPIRRVEVLVSISHENDIEGALRFLRQAAETNTETISTENIEVAVTNVKDYVLSLTLRFWVPAGSLRSTTSEIYKEITRLFRENNIELAVPLRKYVNG